MNNLTQCPKCRGYVAPDAARFGQTHVCDPNAIVTNSASVKTSRPAPVKKVATIPARTTRRASRD